MIARQSVSAEKDLRPSVLLWNSGDRLPVVLLFDRS